MCMFLGPGLLCYNHNLGTCVAEWKDFLDCQDTKVAVTCQSSDGLFVVPPTKHPQEVEYGDGGRIGMRVDSVEDMAGRPAGSRRDTPDVAFWIFHLTMLERGVKFLHT